eukprot:TRINITY_DN1846_c0_g1_i1.p1 TRINITY_DN1846_c0_g1~~TRINITY_DN1846_c0_g1_i1.p1  ORF type:complete len:445 (+),score=49.90 TRINITY_DN1846_c0_g1_i1:60-1394(+)
MLVQRLSESCESGNQPQGKKAVLLVVLYVIVIFFTAGVIIGYGQLYPMLVESEVFHWECNSTVSWNQTCPEQQLALDDMFNTGASVSIFIQAVAGIMLDFIGPKLTSIIGLSFLIPGSVLFGFSTPVFNYYNLGFQLLSAGGPLVFVSTMHVPALFPGYSGLLMAILNGSYSGGALIFFVFNEVYYKYNVSLKILFLAYAGCMGFIFILALFFWPWVKFSEKTEYKPVNVQEDFENYKMGTCDKVLRYLKKVGSQVFSVHYIYLLVMISFFVLDGNFFLATSDQQLSLISDDEDLVNEYSTILALMIPSVGLVLGPVGLAIDKLGIAAGCIFLVVVSAGTTVAALFPIMPLQLFRFILFSIAYPYTYALWASFLVEMFGYDNYGVLFSGVALCSGLLNLIGNWLISEALEKGFYLVNLVLTGVSGVFLIYPIGMLIYKCCENES